MSILKNAQVAPVIAVDDLERATTFYADKLGLESRQTDRDRGMAVMQAGAGSWLLLYTSTFPRGETTVASFAVDDVEGTVAELRATGVDILDLDLPDLKTENGIARYDGQTTAWFRDSEGNTLAVAQRFSE